MNHQNTSTQHSPPSSSAPGTSSTELLTEFAELPRNVQRMMHERGFLTPEGLRSSEGFMRLIEQNLDAAVLNAVLDPQADYLRLLYETRASLSGRSAEALAIHLYTRELLRLITLAATRQQAAVNRRRQGSSREKQLLLTVRRYLSRR